MNSPNKPAAAPGGARTLRVVNILLTLCLALMVARLYQKYAASLEPPGAGRGGGGERTRASQLQQDSTALGASSSSSSASQSAELDVEGLPRMWKQRSYHPSKAVAATGAAAGPAALASLKGRCFYFVVPDRTIKIEWCYEDHVQQVQMPVYSSMDSGWYAGWKREGGKFLYQEFLNGERCGAGFDFPRSTKVHLRCKPDAKGTLYSEMSRGVDLIEFKEEDVCKYSLTVGLKAWCDVEEGQGTT